MKKFQSYSSRETTKLGNDFAKKILAGKFPLQKTIRGAVVLALEGELGAGKTTFTQGFARGLGIRRKPSSPTFVIMRRYPIRTRGSAFRNLYHIDAYRIKKPDALEMLGLREILGEPSSIVLIEWAERVRKILPKNLIRIRFTHGKNEQERVIIM